MRCNTFKEVESKYWIIGANLNIVSKTNFVTLQYYDVTFVLNAINFLCVLNTEHVVGISATAGRERGGHYEIPRWQYMQF